MTTTVNLRKILHRKNVEFMNSAPFATAATTGPIASSRHFRQLQYVMQSNALAWTYEPSEDAWQELPAPGFTTAIAAGTNCSTCTSIGPSGTVTAGTTTTLTTNLNLQRDIRGYKIRITAGPNAGSDIVIVSNTIGAASVITVAAQLSAFTTASTFTLITTKWFVLNGATATQMRWYDFALNTWNAASVVGAPGTVGTDCRLIATPSNIENNVVAMATGTAASSTSTITTTTKNWTASQWINYQVRITTGTGAGQTRIITANTGGASSTFTVGSAWTITPDNTSVYSIEGNDDNLYLMGNNAVTLYKYSISGNSWSTLSPGTPRAAAPVAGMSGHWMWGGAGTDANTTWNNEAAIISGRRIYSFRGTGTVCDYYDIPGNTWVSGIAYAPAATSIAAAGTKYSIIKGRYLAILQGGTSRLYLFDPAKSEMRALGQFVYPQGAALTGNDTMFDISYVDPATPTVESINWIYILLNTSAVLLRIPLI